jgi:hypothetical protein
MAIQSLAVYTTLYPGVEPYLNDWRRSLSEQTDTGFDLWLGVDQLSPVDLERVAQLPPAIWIRSEPRDTPAQIRQRAFEKIVERYDALVLLDADDILAPDRIESARRMLENTDVCACALRLIDSGGADLGCTFGPRADVDPAQLLPRYNVFGLSNSAYRCAVLKNCLPVPRKCVLIDWLLATRAWSLSTRLRFEPEPHMYYRQHESNIARVTGPFSATHVREATARALDHYDTMLTSSWPMSFRAAKLLEAANKRAQRFAKAILSESVLDTYVTKLNELPREYVWWWSVAHPEQEYLRNTGRLPGAR